MRMCMCSYIRMMNILLVALLNEFNSICVNYNMSVIISAPLDRDYDVFVMKVADVYISSCISLWGMISFLVRTVCGRLFTNNRC